MALAQAALRERKLARVYFVPAARSPLKIKGPLVSASVRAALVRAAIRGRAGMALGRWEMDRLGPSFTYETLRRLRKLFPARRWELILGEDAWRQLRRWHRWRDLMKEVPIIVGKRDSSPGGPGPSPVIFLKKRIPSVSSTEIRNALSRGRSVRRELDPSVLRLIKKKGLYS